MEDSSSQTQVFQQYMTCKDSQELAHFIETTPEALDFDFHREVAGNLQPWISEGLSEEARNAMGLRAQEFFRILGDHILTKADAEQEEKDLMERTFSAEKIELNPGQCIQDVVTRIDTDLKLARSQVDLIRTITHLVLNLLAVESLHKGIGPFDPNFLEFVQSQERLAGIATRMTLNVIRNSEIEKKFLSLWLPIIDRLLSTQSPRIKTNWKRILALLRKYQLDETRQCLQGWLDRFLAGEWRSLPLHSPCKASLHLVFCPACHSFSWVEFWNVIHRNDVELSNALIDGRINQWRCTFCSHTPSKRMGIPANVIPTTIYAGMLPIPDYLDSAFLYRMVYYHDPEYGLIFRTPDSITHKQSQSSKVLEMRSLFMVNAARSDFPELSEESTLKASHFVYSDEEFQDKLHHLEMIRQQLLEDDNLSEPSNVYRQLFIPLAQGVRNGEFSLESAEERVSTIYRHAPFIWSKGVISLRSFDAADSNDAIMLALIAAMNIAAGFPEAAAFCLMTAAVQSAMVGRWGESLRFLDKMDNVFSAVEPGTRNILRTQIEGLKAQFYLSLGDTEQGLFHLRESLTLNREPLTTAETKLNYIASLMTYGGEIRSSDIEEAYQALNEALQLCNQFEQTLQGSPPDPQDMRYFLHCKSGVLNNLGRLMASFIVWGHLLANLSILSSLRGRGNLSEEEEQESLSSALNSFSEQMHVPPHAFTKNIAAFVEHVLENPKTKNEQVNWGSEVFEKLKQREIEYYEQAYRLSSTQNDYRFSGIQAMNIADYHGRQADLEQALHYYQLSEKHFREANDSQGLFKNLVAFGEFLIDATQFTEARAKLKSAYQEWMRLRRYLVLDDLRVLSGKVAEPLLKQIPRVLTDDQPDEWITILETLKSASLNDALTYQPIRLSNMLPDEPIVRELTELEKQIEHVQSQRIINELMWSAGRGILKSRGMSIISGDEITTLTLEELQNLYDQLLQKVLLQHPRFSRWYANIQVQFPSVAELLSTIEKIGKDVAFIGLWIDQDNVLVYGASPGTEKSLFAFRVPLLARLHEEGSFAYQHLEQFVADYRTKLFELASAPEKLAEFQRQFAQPLFRALWQPIETKLERATQIIVSGHGAFHGFPWGTMWDGDNYVTERYALSQIFSLNLLLHIDKISSLLKEPSVLALGNPWLGDARLELPFAYKEVQIIGELVSQAGGHCQCFLDKDANDTNLFVHSKGKDIIHLACHAHFDKSDPEEACLLLAADSSNQHDVEKVRRLTMRKIAEKLDLEGTSLVVLSACESGLAQVWTGDEVLGLTRSFYLAGSSRVMASLWYIDDESTSFFMARMYFHLLHERQTFANSLRLAQLDLLHDTSSSDTSNPFVWGSFVLYGV